MTVEITQREARVVDLLAQAWNEYLLLPVEHPMAQAEFCTAIHRCQDMVLARSGRGALNHAGNLAPGSEEQPQG